MIDGKDDLAILVCQIKVWNVVPPNWFKIPKVGACTMLHECEQIEITQSYKELVGKCVLHIPRGTIIEKGSDYGSVLTGNKTSQNVERDVKAATGDGDVLVPGTGVDEKGKQIMSVQPFRDDIGIIQVPRGADSHLATADDFAVGNRIQVRCGYVYGDNASRADEAYNEDSPPELKVVFTGIITGCSVDSPLEVECEDMASLLKKTNCPKFTLGRDYNLNDFLDKNGVDILGGTGIPLSNATVECADKINVGRIDLSTSTTVSDLLTKIANDNGVMSYMETNPTTGMSYLRIGKAYYNGDGGLQADNPEYISYNSGNHAVTIIRSDWDVADDRLEISKIDKQFLVIDAKGELKDGKKFGFSLRKAPDGPDKTDFFDIVNRRKPRPKKKGKRKKAPSGMVVESTADKVDLKQYIKVVYKPSKKYTTESELIEEAKLFWKQYSPNGVSGSIVVFGDVYVTAGDVVGIVNKRQPEKNGYYIVESVSTKFGVEGFRRELKLPYRLGALNMEEIK